MPRAIVDDMWLQCSGLHAYGPAGSGLALYPGPALPAAWGLGKRAVASCTLPKQLFVLTKSWSGGGGGGLGTRLPAGRLCDLIVSMG